VHDLEVGCPMRGAPAGYVSLEPLVLLARVHLRAAVRIGVFDASATVIPLSCLGFSGTAGLCMLQRRPLMPVE
jgi:hypothetical protein